MEGVGGGSRRHPSHTERLGPEAVRRELRFGLGGHDNHGALGAARGPDIGHFKTESRERIETRATGDRHFHDAKLSEECGGLAPENEEG